MLGAGRQAGRPVALHHRNGLFSTSARCSAGGHETSPRSRRDGGREQSGKGERMRDIWQAAAEREHEHS